ncbi:hypothetical protein HUT18_09300 [Streptomyces sp. NA04227]|uniref:hypothetical protein n=1 Tax=Streptomyces sp. NA04227 TaxID=2742136 RepID=UPI00158FEEA1|nr:hypothetical protein [Streptomyces sp. NA04227]QKW06567.1 hypothetical protein HUT18_09300 [Streptomyces sp. NA04227]
MSIPGSQPNPNQPNPYQAPYQPTQGAGIPSPYQPPATPPGQPPAQPPGQQFGPPLPPAPPGAGSGKSRGWLWALGGIVVASAVWAGALFATGTLGGSDDDPDFGGNKFAKDLCGAAELSAFTDEKYEIDDMNDDDDSASSRQPAIDQSQCNRSLKDNENTSSSYASTYLYTSAVWHKKVDPTEEFLATSKAYEDFSTKSYSYKTESVEGLGDEAILTVEERGDVGKKEFGGMRLAVREGWFTMEMRWSYYGGTDDDAPSRTEIEKMLKADVKETLAALKKG